MSPAPPDPDLRNRFEEAVAVSITIGFGMFLVGTLVVGDAVLALVETVSPDLARSLHGRSMMNPQWRAWWGYYLFLGANVAAGTVIGVAAGVVAFRRRR